MGQNVILRFWWESWLSSVSRNHLTRTFLPLRMFQIVFRFSSLYPKQLSCILSAMADERMRQLDMLPYQIV